MQNYTPIIPPAIKGIIGGITSSELLGIHAHKSEGIKLIEAYVHYAFCPFLPRFS